MADTTITITIPEAQWSAVQTAMAYGDETLETSDITATYIKNRFINELKNVMAGYDRRANVTVNSTTFSPS